MMLPTSEIHVHFEDFVRSFKQTLKSVFHDKEHTKEVILRRGFPPLALSKIMATSPFSVAIPEVYGGRGSKPKECLGMLDAASYESLPLSLMFGINTGLFLGPVAKYGQEAIKKPIFNRFLNEQNMGGLMITEPDFGSDALNMHTTNVRTGSGYRIKGVKHWQGLTGMADYWLMTSRQKLSNGELGRDIDFFICDVHQAEQRIEVEEYYNNIGLYPIPYGKNIIDILVPSEYKLQPESTGLKLMMDLLNRSRLQFPGMATGFIRRLLDDSIKQCNSRIIRGKPLMALDQVQHQIAQIQSAFTISSAMCLRSASISGIENDLSSATIEANSMKAYVTDLMQESAQTLMQLSGANGYKAESKASRGIVDSRPFQIFEGSNEMLYTQISEVVIKMMENLKKLNLFEFFKDYSLTTNAADYFKSLIDFKADQYMPQRKRVGFGKIVSRIIAADYVETLGAQGFRSDLIRSSIETIRHEITTLVGSFQSDNDISPVEDYNEESSWLEFC